MRLMAGHFQRNYAWHALETKEIMRYRSSRMSHIRKVGVMAFCDEVLNLIVT